MGDTKQLDEIEVQLRQMGPEQLALIAQFIRSILLGSGSESWDVLLATESSLRKNWESPEEDAAWADL
jgi:hypothetical protein